MPLVERYRASVGQVALEAEGAHYLHGAFGNHPDVCNGHPAQDGRVGMAPNVYAPTPQRAVRVHAARTNITGVRHCWGRPDAAHLPPPVPQALLRDPAGLERLARQAPGAYRWPRTDSGGPGTAIMGEACQGKRHFDCIGFVSWVMFRIFGTLTIRDIVSCQRYAMEQAGQHPELLPPRARYEVGDILIFNINHIAIALDEHFMIEAQGERLGVLRSPMRAGVTNVLRPTDDLLRRIWNVGVPAVARTPIAHGRHAHPGSRAPNR